ncbi:unnamed protein product, partial [Mesorhabditis belari]|uniref:Fatty acid desaturase domain-containing protein n=1 Tax=Mesorhabditis belari TaxID=2138241 RepID=A0AAF3EFD9_9BILA
MVFVQMFFCWLIQDEPFLLVFLMAYISGGIINHALTLAIHDISHNTAFGQDRPLANRFFGMFANLPIGVPISISFKKYHIEHHRYLAEEGLDTDVPTELEGIFFKTPLRKLLWLFLQPLFYGFRPLIIYKKAPTDLEIINFILQIGFDIFILQFFGWKALFYLVGGTILAMGLHPSAFHFISEHYSFSDKQETYSYYGWFNYVTFNVGYHMEHHDFPYIPGRDLPKLRAMAPEFYDTLETHDSWWNVLHGFVMNPAIGPYARIKRKPRVDQQFWSDNVLTEYVDALLHYIGYFAIRDALSSTLSANFYNEKQKKGRITKKIF